MGDLSSLWVSSVLRGVYQFLLSGSVEDHEYDPHGGSGPVSGEAGAGRVTATDGED